MAITEIFVHVDAHRAGATLSARPGFDLVPYLARRGAKARAEQVTASGEIADVPRSGRSARGGH